MQNILTEAPLETLKRYIDQPSGSFDKEDVHKMAEIIASDFEKLGFTVELIPGEVHGPKVRATIGKGEKQLMLMGHMDTVFPMMSMSPSRILGTGEPWAAASLT